MAQRAYLVIDLKSFYASVECAERGLDPLTTNLVVADPDRSKNTICLAISPSMKALGIRNRCRLREIPPNIEYITAKPRMQLYIDYSAEIYAIYLSYIAKEDIHVYSIDEAFLDVTDYLTLYNTTPRDLGKRIMNDISEKLHIRATCGIGTNMYLAKIALDIVSKHSPDFIGELTEESFKEKLWNHRPLTDFWRIGHGTDRKLRQYGMETMKDIAMADEETLYKLFGIDAELMIDHAWGRESTTMADIHNYHSKNNSLTNGQVLMKDYSYEDALLVVKEMADLLCLDLVDKHLLTRSISLYVGYADGFTDGSSTGGSITFEDETSSDFIIIPAFEQIYAARVNPEKKIRRLNLCCSSVIPEEYHQYNMFIDPEMTEKDRRAQRAAIEIKKKFGKDAILKGMNLLDNATTRTRNHQIGGHNSGE